MDHNDLESAPLFLGEPLAAFLPPGHKLAERSDSQAGRPSQTETLVVFPKEAHPALHERLLSLIGEAGYRFQGLRDAGGMNPRDIMLSVAEGLGVALGPVSLQERERRRQPRPSPSARPTA